MSESIIAKRYAGALLAAADDAKADIGTLVAELAGWAQWLSAGEEGAEALLSPVLPRPQQAAFLNVLLDKTDAHPLIGGLLRVGLSKGRLSLMSRIVDTLQDELNRRSGVVEGSATSSHKLDDGLKQQIADKISNILSKTTKLEWREDDSLLGGFKVQVGQTVWDASLQHQLNRLEDSIRKGVM